MGSCLPLGPTGNEPPGDEVLQMLTGEKRTPRKSISDIDPQLYPHPRAESPPEAIGSGRTWERLQTLPPVQARTQLPPWGLPAEASLSLPELLRPRDPPAPVALSRTMFCHHTQRHVTTARRRAPPRAAILFVSLCTEPAAGPGFKYWWNSFCSSSNPANPTFGHIRLHCSLEMSISQSCL